MSTIAKTILLAAAVFVFQSNYAQTNVKKSNTTQTTEQKTTAKKPAPVYGKEIQVTLKNLAEGTVSVFAGPKEDLKNKTKRKTVGGLGTNTLYVRINEVVCIMNGQKTVSCTAVKATTKLLEINSSALAITEK
jgi:hypothetical protein